MVKFEVSHVSCIVVFTLLLQNWVLDSIFSDIDNNLLVTDLRLHFSSVKLSIPASFVFTLLTTSIILRYYFFSIVV